MHLGDFAAVEPAVVRYLDSIKNYQKNRHSQIDPATREKIVARWGPMFAAWGYPT